MISIIVGSLFSIVSLTGFSIGITKFYNSGSYDKFQLETEKIRLQKELQKLTYYNALKEIQQENKQNKANKNQELKEQIEELKRQLQDLESKLDWGVFNMEDYLAKLFYVYISQFRLFLFQYIHIAFIVDLIITLVLILLIYIIFWAVHKFTYWFFMS